MCRNKINQFSKRVAGTGFASHVAALKNENLYYNNFVIPTGRLVPLSAETVGRFDATFCKFLKEVVASGLDIVSRPYLSGPKRSVFSLHLGLYTTNTHKANMCEPPC